MYHNNDYDNMYQAPGPYDSFDHWEYDRPYDCNYGGPRGPMRPPNNFGGPMRNGPHPRYDPQPHHYDQEWQGGYDGYRPHNQPMYPFSDDGTRRRADYDNMHRNDWRQPDFRQYQGPHRFEDHGYRNGIPNGAVFNNAQMPENVEWSDAGDRGSWDRPARGNDWMQPWKNETNDRRRKTSRRALLPNPEAPPRRSSTSSVVSPQKASMANRQAPATEATTSPAKTTPEAKGIPSSTSSAPPPSSSGLQSAVEVAPVQQQLSSSAAAPVEASSKPSNSPTSSSSASASTPSSSEAAPVQAKSSASTTAVNAETPQQPSSSTAVLATSSEVVSAPRKTISVKKSPSSPSGAYEPSPRRNKFLHIHKIFGMNTKDTFEEVLESLEMTKKKKAPKRKQTPESPEAAKENISDATTPAQKSRLPVPLEEIPKPTTAMAPHPYSNPIPFDLLPHKPAKNISEVKGNLLAGPPPKKRKTLKKSRWAPAELQQDPSAAPVHEVQKEAEDETNSLATMEVQLSLVTDISSDTTSTSAVEVENETKTEAVSVEQPQMAEEPIAPSAEDHPTPSESSESNAVENLQRLLLECNRITDSLAPSSPDQLQDEVVNVHSAVSPDLPEASRSADEPQPSSSSSVPDDGQTTAEPTYQGLQVDVKIEVEDHDGEQHQVPSEVPEENQIAAEELSTSFPSQILVKEGVEDPGFEQAGFSSEAPTDAPEEIQRQENEERTQEEDAGDEASDASSIADSTDEESEDEVQEEHVEELDGNKENEPIEKKNKKKTSQGGEEEEPKQDVIPPPDEVLDRVLRLLDKKYDAKKISIKDVVKMKNLVQLKHPEKKWDFSYLTPLTEANFEAGTKFLDRCVDLFENKELTKDQVDQLIEWHKRMFPGVKHNLEVIRDEDPEVLRKKAASKKALTEVLEKFRRPQILPNFNVLVHERKIKSDMWEHACVRCLCHNVVEVYGSKMCQRRHAFCESVNCSDCLYDQEDQAKLFEKWSKINCFHSSIVRGKVEDDRDVEKPSMWRVPRPKKRRLCTICRRPGHFKNVCPKKKIKDKQNKDDKKKNKDEKDKGQKKKNPKAVRSQALKRVHRL